MSRHRRPVPRPPLLARPTVRIAAIGTAAALLPVASLAAIANDVGNDFTPAAQSTPTISRPVDDDPGQRGMRGLPTPARIFPTDLNPPHYEPETACRCTPRVPPVALSAPPRVRSVPVTASQPESVSQSPSTLAAVTSQQISETTTSAAEPTADPTTAAASSSPTTTDTQEEDMPQPTLPSGIDELIEEVTGE